MAQAHHGSRPGRARELLEQAELLQEGPLTPEQSSDLPPDVRAQVELEIADVLLFLLRLCDKLDVDPIAAGAAKLEINRQRYPVEKAKGRATKYDKL